MHVSSRETADGFAHPGSLEFEITVSSAKTNSFRTSRSPQRLALTLVEKQLSARDAMRPSLHRVRTLGASVYERPR